MASGGGCDSERLARTLCIARSYDLSDCRSSAPFPYTHTSTQTHNTHFPACALSVNVHELYRGVDTNEALVREKLMGGESQQAPNPCNLRDTHPHIHTLHHPRDSWTVTIGPHAEATSLLPLSRHECEAASAPWCAETRGNGASSAADSPAKSRCASRPQTTARACGEPGGTTISTLEASRGPRYAGRRAHRIRAPDQLQRRGREFPCLPTTR